MDTSARDFQDAQGELCHEGSCEPQLVGSDCRLPSPITCLWNLLAWSGKCCGNMQESLGDGEGLPMSLEENTTSCFSIEAEFFSSFQLPFPAPSKPACVFGLPVSDVLAGPFPPNKAETCTALAVAILPVWCCHSVTCLLSFISIF